jgi:O-antigen/teichoic acid export membrane protein
MSDVTAGKTEADTLSLRLLTASAISRSTFFRQSGWMVIASAAGGACMYAVHLAAGKMEKPEYGVFGTLLHVLNLMAIPSIGLQTIVMRQTVAAITEPHRRALSRAIRSLLWGMLGLWVVIVVAAFVCRTELLALWKISNPAALYITMSWGLWAFWLPIFTGLLQGRQNFLWMGGVSIAGGMIRLMAVSIIVLLLGGQAAGAALGVLIAMAAASVIAAWHSREVWLGPGQPVPWKDWLKRVLPLTLGPGTVMYMMSLDMIVVQAVFPKEETGYYAAAGMIGRALVFLTAPLTAVMFPKIVDASARSEKSNAMLLALGATALLGTAAALFCSAFPSLPLRIVYDASYLKVTWLVPWFAWCMLPLTLGSVLANNLVAREQYRAVLWIVLVALCYGVLLVHAAAQDYPTVEAGLKRIVQTTGTCGVLLLAVCLWFTLRGRKPHQPGPVAVLQPVD